MSKEIIIYENKTLKLCNVLSRIFIVDDSFGEKPFELRVKEFNDFILNNSLVGYGPLIIKNTIIGTTDRKLQISLMRQLKNDSVKVTYPYSFQKEFKTPPSLFSRFKGKECDSGIANLKMQVYAYENDLVLDVESYAITTKEENEFVVDTFVPILGRC